MKPQTTETPAKGNDKGYTPGEWKIENHNSEEYLDIEGASRICSILIDKTELEEIGSSVEEAYANAKLIASAPKLKIENEQLKELLIEINDYFSEQYPEVDEEGSTANKFNSKINSILRNPQTN